VLIKVSHLQELEDRYRILVENMGEGLLVLDRDMHISFVNNRLCDVWGYSKDELLGKRILSFFEGQSRKIIRREFRKRTTGKSSTYLLLGKTKRGEEKFFSVSAVPFIDRERGFNGSIVIISDITERKKMEEELQERSIELEKEVKKRTEQLVDLYKEVAITDERSKLAQEIHDSLAQTLATALLKIELCERLLEGDPAKAKKELSNLRKMLGKSIRTTRHIIFDLRLPRFHRTEFTTLLKRYLEEFGRKTGITWTLNTQLEESLPTDLQLGTYRIIREAMNNIRKHALGKSVVLDIRTDKDRNLYLVIEDDGRGFDLEKTLNENKHKKRFGLTGMEEQAKLLGGSFTIESAKGQGTKIRVKVPLGELEGVK